MPGSDAVHQVEAKSKTGCGMLVSFKGLLAVLTNNHIITDKASAEGAIAIFQTASMGTVSREDAVRAPCAARSARGLRRVLVLAGSRADAPVHVR
eukprot:303364-Rhodomonas_salina.2